MCKTCKSPDILLNKENRLYFTTCESSGSRESNHVQIPPSREASADTGSVLFTGRSVAVIKTGFQARSDEESNPRLTRIRHALCRKRVSPLMSSPYSLCSIRCVFGLICRANHRDHAMYQVLYVLSRRSSRPKAYYRFGPAPSGQDSAPGLADQLLCGSDRRIVTYLEEDQPNAICIIEARVSLSV